MESSSVFFKNLVQIQLIFLFFGLNFAEFFQHEKNEKIKHWKAGFLLRILWCSQSGNHPQNNLAKFGYILNMKVQKKKKKQNASMFLATTTTYHKNLVILIQFSSKSSKFGPFYHEKSLVKILFSMSKFDENSTVKVMCWNILG